MGITMGKKLESTELREALVALPEWKVEDGEIVRWFLFDDFPKSIDFVNRVAVVAEATNHHPDIDIRYNRVRLALVTHDSGGVTLRDIKLAKVIEGEIQT